MRDPIPVLIAHDEPVVWSVPTGRRPRKGPLRSILPPIVPPEEKASSGRLGAAFSSDSGNRKRQRKHDDAERQE